MLTSFFIIFVPAIVVISFIAGLEFIAYRIRCTTGESEKIVKIKLVDISQTKSAFKIIFSSLRKAIVESDITVGAPLHQDDLARSFQTSSIPTKEVANNAMDKVDRYIRAQLIVIDGMDKAKKEHVGILDACLTSNADSAAELPGKHILGAEKSPLASFPT